MEHRIDILQRFSLRIFSEASTATVSPSAVIPIFHRWIQKRAVKGLLIDVADYTHLPDGPSAMLVGHEANFSLDGNSDRQGLAYWHKRDSNRLLAERLTVGVRTLLSAALLLESDTASLQKGRLIFCGNEIEFCANDRLVAPKTSDTSSALYKILEIFGTRLFGGSPISLTPLENDNRFGFTVKTVKDTSLSQLINNLG